MDQDQPRDPPTTDDDRLPGAKIAFCRFASDGDASALEQCFVQCVPHLHRVACRILPGPEHLDLVQECLVVAIQRVADYDQRRPLLPWLIGILNNLARSRHRRRWHRLVSLDSLSAPEAATPAGAAEDAMALRHWRSQAEQSIQQLQPLYREVVERHLLREQPLVAIARDLGVPSSTIRARLRRGLEQLRRRLPTAGGLTLAAVLAARSANAADGPPLLLRRSTGFGTKSALLAVAAAVTFAVLTQLAPPETNGPEQDASTVAAPAPLASVVQEADEGATTPARTPLTTPAAPATGSLKIVARSPDGRATAHQLVVLRPALPGNANRTRPTWRVVKTDANGVAEFSDLMPGSYLVALDEGFGRTHQVEVGSGSSELRTYPAASGLLAVRVEDDSGPVADAEVLIGGADLARCLGLSAGHTDASGRLVVRPGKHLWIWARVSGRIGAAQQRIATFVGEHVIRLTQPFQRCEGMVLDAQKQPVAGATVAVWAPGNPGIPPVFVATDATGYFSTQDVPLGTWRAFAAAPGLAPGDSGEVEGGSRLVLTLDTGGTVRVKVPNGLSSGLACLLTGPELHMNPLGPVAIAAAAGETLQFDHVPAGRHIVNCYTDASEILSSAVVDVGFAGTVEVELPPPAPPTHEVTVVDESGNPVVNCFVVGAARLAAARVMGRPQTRRTDRHGRVQFRTEHPHSLVLLAYVATAAGRVPLPIAWNLDAQPGTARLVVPSHCRDVGQIRTRLVNPGRLPRKSLDLVLTRSVRHHLQPITPQPLHVSNLSPGIYEAMLFAVDTEQSVAILCPSIEVPAGGCADFDLDVDRVACGSILLEVPATAARSPMFIDVHHSSLRRLCGLRIAPGASHRVHLAAGDYTLSYLDERGDLASVPCTVAPGEDRSLRLSRSAGTPCIIRLPTGRGGDPDGPGLTVRRAGGRVEVTIQTVAEFLSQTMVGTFDLMPGDYVLTAASTSGRCERAFTVPPDVAEFTLDVELP